MNYTPRYWISKQGEVRSCANYYDEARLVYPNAVHVLYDLGWLRVIIESNSIWIHGPEPKGSQKDWLLDKRLQLNIPVINGDTRREVVLKAKESYDN